jgi:hypothetical protein
MKITSVSYTRLQTLSGYNNERVGATADVDYDTGETPEEALNSLRAWVEKRLLVEIDVIERGAAIERLGWRRDELEQNIAHLETRYEQLQIILRQHGVAIEDLDNVPF